MIPFGFRNFRIPSTGLYLNGPRLIFNSQPSDVVANAGDTASFTAAASASFNELQDGSVDGIIEYRWYNQNGPLLNGPNISGANTTKLTISNISSNQDQSIYLRATYIPGNYNSTRKYINYKTSGKAINSPLDSDIASLKIRPSISITSQPVSNSATEGETATFSASASISNTSYTLTYYWKVNGIIVANSNKTSIELTKSGTGTDTVQFFAETNFEGTTITASSSEVSFGYIAPRNIVVFEGFSNSDSSLYASQETNLDSGNFTLNSSTFGSNYNIITFYAKEKNVNLIMDIKASKGSDNGARIGGQGGTSTISLTLAEDTEYTVLGISNNSAVFLYEGSELLAVVGQGGNAGTTGNGGAGGGVDLAGANGVGTNAGTGGTRITSGNLTLNGIFGSILAGSSITLQSGDTVATAPDGGRTISCTKGIYWLNQGVSACSNNSTSPIKFRIGNGTEVSSSDEIIRGLKAGYTITTTAGDGVNNGGDGGNGATGGSGGTSGAGGGGGSGYTNGVVTVTSSTLGGNTSTSSSIVFRV